MPRFTKTYDDLIGMAESYGVESNALFIAAARQYELQQQVIEKIRKEIIEADEATTTKEYVKGRENVCVHPLIQQLPKHLDSANRTLQTMLDIITKLGREQPKSDKLGEFLNG